MQIVLRVERGRKVEEISIVPTSKTAEGKELGYGRIGISLGSQTVIERSGPVDALRRSAIHNINIVSLTVGALYRIITGAAPAEIGGPIRISAIAAEQARRGLRFLVGFTILLSVNLAILNLLPIPVLDGGHIFFLLLEALRGKPLGDRVRDMAMQVGLVLLIGLMLFATFKDSVYYFSRWTSGASGERRWTVPPKPPAPRPVPSEGR
jgi:regulator of sigma E protease